MNTLTKTVITIMALNLLTAVVVPAQNASDEEIQAAKADIGVLLAQAQVNQPVTPVPTAPAASTPPTPVQPSLESSVSRNEFNTNAFSLGGQPGSGDVVLVIPTAQTGTEDLLAINEDMNIMSRIFEKNLEQDHITTMHGGIFAFRYNPYEMMLGGSRGDVQSMYLQGYGALFMLKVDFPLSPSPQAQQEQKEPEKQEKGDTVWRQMKQEMYEPENVMSNRNRRMQKQEEKYDAQQVENLKTTLIKTLKHASNIRSMKPDESLIMTVIGSGGSTGATITALNVAGNNQVIVQEKNADGRTTTKIIQKNALNDIGLSSPTVLVIRAKKSDIDDFAKGNLDFDKFRERVQVLTYPLLSGAIGNSNSALLSTRLDNG
jgi:hypothetical protein